jgi:hypothetical protein
MDPPAMASVFCVNAEIFEPGHQFLNPDTHRFLNPDTHRTEVFNPDTHSL